MRRGEPCSLANTPPQDRGSILTSPILSNNYGLQLQQVPCHGFRSGLNMLQMALFHNFAENTAASLPFGGNVWQDDVVPLALKVML
jgi:hypothetical protein